MMHKRMHSREFKLDVVRQIASGKIRPAQRSDTTYLLDTSTRKVVLEEVQDLCRRLPIPHYSVAR